MFPVRKLFSAQCLLQVRERASFRTRESRLHLELAKGLEPLTL
jgi:hypothetical protein